MSDLHDPHFDLDAWPAPEPSPDFADGVLAELDRAAPRKRRMGVVFGVVGATVLATAAMVAVLARPAAPVMPTFVPGELLADETREIELGPGARAVVERYAHLVWTAAGVVQDRGDVFYRLAPGVHLDVTTPTGAVSSEGACSRVKIVDGESGAPTVLVSVAQGHVEVRGKSTPNRVVLAAGRYARVDPDRIRTDADDADGSISYALASDRAHRFAETIRPREESSAPPKPIEPKTAPRIPSAPPALPSVSAAPSASAPKRTLRIPRCECQPSDSLCACFDLDLLCRC